MIDTALMLGARRALKFSTNYRKLYVTWQNSEVLMLLHTLMIIALYRTLTSSVCAGLTTVDIITS